MTYNSWYAIKPNQTKSTSLHIASLKKSKINQRVLSSSFEAKFKIMPEHCYKHNTGMHPL